MTGAQLDAYVWPVRWAVFLLVAWLGVCVVMEFADWLRRQRRRKGKGGV